MNNTPLIIFLFGVFYASVALYIYHLFNDPVDLESLKALDRPFGSPKDSFLKDLAYGGKFLFDLFVLILCIIWRFICMLCAIALLLVLVGIAFSHPMATIIILLTLILLK